MKKLFYILAMTLMVLASASCTKKMVPLYLKGTTWVCTEGDGISVIKFDTRRTFHADEYLDGKYYFTSKCKIAEVMDSQVYFEIVSISIPPEDWDQVLTHGIMTLLNRNNIETVMCKDNWGKILEESRCQFVRDDNFNISNYVER